MAGVVEDQMKREARRLARAIGPLPESAHGRIILHVRAGRVHTMEIQETELVPPSLDKGKPSA